MTRATSVDVLEYGCCNPSILTAEDNPHFQEYESHHLAKAFEVNPPSFDVYINIDPDAEEQMPNAELWLKRARFKTGRPQGERVAVSDFFDLPGLSFIKHIQPDENGEHAAIMLRFDDWTGEDVKEQLDSKETQEKGDRRPFALTNRMIEQQQQILDDTASQSIRDVYTDIILGRLTQKELLSDSAAKLCYRTMYECDESVAEDRLFEAKAIGECLRLKHKEHARG